MATGPAGNATEHGHAKERPVITHRWISVQIADLARAEGRAGGGLRGYRTSRYGRSPDCSCDRGADAEFIIKVGPALGIVLIIATQRPDKASLPTPVSGNASIRFCLYVAGQTENDMILGSSAYKNGLRATMFRPEIDAGLGWLKGATPEPKVTRTHCLNVKEAGQVAARARIARQRAGTLTGAALGEDTAGAARDVLADALAVFGGDARAALGHHRRAARRPLAGSLGRCQRRGGVGGAARPRRPQRPGQPRRPEPAGCRREALEALQA
jgi:hypothetical protein